jgi:hypothetical protein
MARQKQVGADCVIVIGVVAQSEDVTNSLMMQWASNVLNETPLTTFQAP